MAERPDDALREHVRDDPGDDAGEIRERVLGWLARREHSRRELEQKLARKGAAAVLVGSVLDECEAQDLLSDERFAAAYVESRVNRGFGPLRIGEELRQRGIASSTSKAALEVYAAQWTAWAAQARCKRFGDSLPESFEERARQGRFLAGRGFSQEQLRAVLRGDP